MLTVPNELHFFISGILPLFLAINLGVFLYLLWVLRKRLFKGFNHRYLLLILVAAFIIRAFVFPHTSYNLGDEATSIRAAQLFADQGSFHNCWRYDADGVCADMSLNEDGPTYAFFLSIPFFLFGPSIHLTIWLMILFSCAGIAFIYFLAATLWNRKAGFVSAFLLTFSYLHAFLSPTPAIRIVSSSLMVLTLFLVVLYIREKDFSVLLLMLSSLTFLVQSFPDYLAVVPVILLLVGSRLLDRKVLLAYGVFFGLNIPYLARVGMDILSSPAWQPGIGIASSEFLGQNLMSNVLFYLVPYLHPDGGFLTLVILSYLGIIAVFLKRSRFNSLMFLLAVFYFLFYSSYELGLLDQSLRYNLSIIPLLVVLSGFALSKLSNRYLLIALSVFLIAFVSDMSVVRDLQPYFPEEYIKSDYLLNNEFDLSEKRVLTIDFSIFEAVYHHHHSIDFAREDWENILGRMAGSDEEWVYFKTWVDVHAPESKHRYFRMLLEYDLVPLGETYRVPGSEEEFGFFRMVPVERNAIQG